MSEEETDDKITNKSLRASSLALFSDSRRFLPFNISCLVNFLFDPERKRKNDGGAEDPRRYFQDISACTLMIIITYGVM